MALYPSLLNRLETQHFSIAKIISACAPEQLHLPPEPGKWSIHDNIAHLAKYQPVFSERMEKILAGTEPSFDRYKAENDELFELWRAKKTGLLLGTLNADRKELFTFITAIPAEKLSLCGVHPRYGKMNITEWTEFFLLHEAHHIFTLFQIAHSKSK